MGFFMHSMARSCGGSNNCCHLDEMCSETSVILTVTITSTAVLCYGLLPVHNTEGDAEFELEVNQNHCYFSHSTFGPLEFYLQIP